MLTFIKHAMSFTHSDQFYLPDLKATLIGPDNLS